MIRVGPGVVSLTDRRTQHTWTVEVAPYLLAAVPVTQAGYERVSGQRPSSARGDDLPVERVSWLDAVRYCNALSEAETLTPVYSLPESVSLSNSGEGVDRDLSADGYRLPTEAEWEFACRAGTTGPRYGELADIAWFKGNSLGAVHRAGTKAPNAWGFFDMIGNVWEWCWDLYDPEVYGTYRVLKGGGWHDEQWSCRVSVRRRSHPTFKIDDVGFRVARSIGLPAGTL
jgi:formylglycine-generating enzyme required for sulfatase activity